jgi:hypothetical protein
MDYRVCTLEQKTESKMEFQTYLQCFLVCTDPMTVDGEFWQRKCVCCNLLPLGVSTDDIYHSQKPRFIPHLCMHHHHKTPCLFASELWCQLTKKSKKTISFLSQLNSSNLDKWQFACRISCFKTGNLELELMCFEPHFQRTWYIGTQKSTIWRKIDEEEKKMSSHISSHGFHCNCVAQQSQLIKEVQLSPDFGNGFLHIMYACNSMISSLTLHLCCHCRNILPCVHGWTMFMDEMWMINENGWTFSWTLAILFYFDEKSEKKIGWKKNYVGLFWKIQHMKC